MPFDHSRSSLGLRCRNLVLIIAHVVFLPSFAEEHISLRLENRHSGLECVRFQRFWEIRTSKQVQLYHVIERENP